MFALIVMGVWKTFGVNMVLFSAGLQAFRTITTRRRRSTAPAPAQILEHHAAAAESTTFFILVMSVIGSFQVFDTVYVLTSGGPLVRRKCLSSICTSRPSSSSRWVRVRRRVPPVRDHFRADAPAGEIPEGSIHYTS